MSRLRTQPRAQKEAAIRFRACQSRRYCLERTAWSRSVQFPWRVDTKPAADQAESTKCCTMLPSPLGDKGRQFRVSCMVG